MNFREFLTETTIKDIQKQDKIFVMIIGGGGSGKNYIYRKYFSGLKLFDVDEYLSGEDSGKSVSKAIKQSEKDLEEELQKGNSAVSVGTGKSIFGVKNKFKFAEDAGMKTCIILVDVDPKVAYKRMLNRSKTEERDEIPLYKIEKTNKAARDNFTAFAKMADFSLILKN